MCVCLFIYVNKTEVKHQSHFAHWTVYLMFRSFSLHGNDFACKKKRQTVITDCLYSPLVWRVKPLWVSPLTDVAITFGWERWIWVSICPLKTEVNELIQQSIEHLDHPEFTRYERETQHKVSRLFSLVFQNLIMPSFSICFSFLLFF